MSFHIVASQGLIPATQVAGSRSVTLTIPARSTGQVVKSAALQAGYRKVNFESGERGTFTGERRSEAMYIKIPDVTLLVNWAPLDLRSSLVEWVAYRQEAGMSAYPDPAGMTLFENHLRQALSRWSPPPPAPVMDPVVPPGELPPVRYRGQMRDYSALATDHQLQRLSEGVLPFGYSAFGWGEQAHHGPRMYMPKIGGTPGEELGVLICASPGSGKSQLLLSWAAAAIADGRSVFLVDAKGNLRRDLDRALVKAGIVAPVMEFTTEPTSPSGRINFLRGIDVTRPECTEQLKALAAALIPAEFVPEENEFIHQITLQIATACLKVLKLQQWYGPECFKDTQGRLREVDLCDLLDMVEREEALMHVIDWVRAEETLGRSGVRPKYSADECVKAMALALAPHYPDLPGELADGELAEARDFRGGQRPPEQTYMQWMEPLVNALEPFRSNGPLGRRVRSIGQGNEIRLDEFGTSGRPAVVVISAREDNPELAAAVLGMAVQRLRVAIEARKGQQGQLRPMLLLLDDTARISAFDAKDWVTTTLRDSRVS